MKKLSPYCFTKEEKHFLFFNKLRAGEEFEEASKEVARDRAYLKSLKAKNFKKKHKKPKLNFKLSFEELKNGTK